MRNYLLIGLCFFAISIAKADPAAITNFENSSSYNAITPTDPYGNPISVKSAEQYNEQLARYNTDTQNKLTTNPNPPNFSAINLQIQQQQALAQKKALEQQQQQNAVNQTTSEPESTTDNKTPTSDNTEEEITPPITAPAPQPVMPKQPSEPAPTETPPSATNNNPLPINLGSGNNNQNNNSGLNIQY